MNNKEKKHQLSANSRKANADFTYANQLASAIYAVFKKLLERSANREQYRRLHKLLIKIMQHGSGEFLGERKLYHGDVGLLKGFRLNTYTIWDSLLYVKPLIKVDAAEKLLQVELPKMEAKDVKTIPQITSFVLQFACCEIDADTCRVQTHLSAKLVIPVKREGLLTQAKKMTMPLPDMEGKILLVVFIIRANRHEGQLAASPYYTPAEFLSNDRKHYAGEVLKVSYVKDGKEVTYQAAPSEVLPDTTWAKEMEEAAWEDKGDV